MPEWIVLRRQPVKEKDWLLDILTKEQGLIQVRVSPPTQIPDFLTLYSGAWTEGRLWPSVKAVEVKHPYDLKGDKLLCGLYLSELLLKLLAAEEPNPEIYQLLLTTLDGLAQDGSPSIWLRIFEYRLLDALGYGFSWNQAGNHSIVPDQHYRMDLGHGFIEAHQGWSGQSLLAINQGQWLEADAVLVARQVLRQAIDHILPAPLVTRELL